MRQLLFESEIPLIRIDRFVCVDVEDAAAGAGLEGFVALDADAEEASEGIDGNAAKGGAAHGGVEERTVALDEEIAVVDALAGHVRIGGSVEVFECFHSRFQ